MSSYLYGKNFCVESDRLAGSGHGNVHQVIAMTNARVKPTMSVWWAVQGSNLGPAD